MVVPMLEASELQPRQAHATSIGIILPLSIISGIMYLVNGVNMDINTLLWTVPLGLIGAILGAFILMRIKNEYLKKIFGLVMIISAIKILLR